MSRHSKNNTAHSIFTYYERKKVRDSGTIKAHLGGENLRRFEDCWLCLRPAVKPVATLQGYVYCRDCLMSNLATQKEENDKKLLEWEIIQRKKKANVEAEQQRKKEIEVEAFLKANEKISVPVENPFNTKKENLANSRPKFIELDKASNRVESFWVAENTPQYENKKLVTSSLSENNNNNTDADDHKLSSSPPLKYLLCPMSKRRIRLKELIKLKPDLIESQDSSDHDARWTCAFSGKEIGHQKAVVIKRTGQIVLKSYFNQGLLKGFIPEKDVVTKSDVIELVAGATGFVAHNKVETELVRPVMD